MIDKICKRAAKIFDWTPQYGDMAIEYSGKTSLF